MSDAQQTTVFGNGKDNELHLTATGRTLRPAKRMIGAVCDETRLQVTTDGLRVCMVDRYNVVMVELDVPDSAFDAYDVENPTTLGVSMDSLGSVLQHARYGKDSNDMVDLYANNAALRTVVDREFGATEATLRESRPLIDPDLVRETPEIPELDLDVETEIAPETFVRAVNTCADGGNYMVLEASEDTIHLSRDTDMAQTEIDLVADVSRPTDGETLFGMNYLEMVAKGLRSGYVDNVTLKWAEEYPLQVGFEREDCYSGMYFIAPRMRGE